MPDSNTLTVTGLEAHAIRLPLQTPYRTASGTVTAVPLVLIELTTARGITGRSMLFAYSELTLKPLLELVRNMAPQAPVSAATLEKQLEHKSRMVGNQGLVGMALSGIDIALWDAMAKRHQCSLVELLGGEEHDLQAYASIGFEGARHCATHAGQLARRGFHGIKVCIGYPTVQEDINVIQAIRNAIGPDIKLMVDYNQCLSLPEARLRLQMLEELGLYWVEEPILSHDFKGMATLNQHTGNALQSGENWWNCFEIEQAISLGAIDYLMLNSMKCGGVSGWLKAAELARIHDIPLSSNLWPELSSQLLSLSPTAHWLQYSDWWSLLMKSPLQFSQGKALSSGEPGAGTDWDEHIVEHYRLPL